MPRCRKSVATGALRFRTVHVDFEDNLIRSRHRLDRTPSVRHSNSGRKQMYRAEQVDRCIVIGENRHMHRRFRDLAIAALGSSAVLKAYQKLLFDSDALADADLNCCRWSSELSLTVGHSCHRPRRAKVTRPSIVRRRRPIEVFVHKGPFWFSGSICQ